jgi:predicted esterase
MRVTPGAVSARKALLLVLHDAGGSEDDALALFRAGWGSPGLVLVAPGARSTKWSFERGRGDDLATVGHALTQAFSRCPIDPAQVGIGGFAEGATSALSLGITNGRLFHAVVALSPGSIDKQKRVGQPRVFVAHGTGDRVHPFASTRDVLVPELRRQGYSVTFHPFSGGHTVPAEVSRAAVRWFLG